MMDIDDIALATYDYNTVPKHNKYCNFMLLVTHDKTNYCDNCHFGTRGVCLNARYILRLGVK